jgi:hypothetical protein
MAETLLMVDPSGASGEVEMKNVPLAFKQGYERGYRMRAPNGKIETVPLSLCSHYENAGFKFIVEKE